MRKGVYTEIETEKFLRAYVPVAKHVLAHSYADAVVAAKHTGFPLVLKIISPQALHKSEVRGVRLVKTQADFKEEFDDLMRIVKKKGLTLEGILVQEFVRGHYVLIGLKRDQVFGHVLAVASGGIYAELLKDVTFRVCPVTLEDADEMIQELKLKDMLLGFRGHKSVNVSLLKKTIVAVSRIPSKYPEILEMDINPFVINDRTGAVVDARMVV